jgi:hypothetical protein
LYWESDIDSKVELLTKEVSLEEAKACAQRCHEDPTFPGSILESVPVDDVSVMPAPPATPEPANEPESEPAPKSAAVEPSPAAANGDAYAAGVAEGLARGDSERLFLHDHLNAKNVEIRQLKKQIADLEAHIEMLKAAGKGQVAETQGTDSAAAVANGTAPLPPLRTALGEALRAQIRGISAAQRKDDWPPMSQAAFKRVQTGIKQKDFITLTEEYDKAQEKIGTAARSAR